MTSIPRRLKLRSSSFAHVAVLERHDRRQVLEERHLDPVVVEHRGELGADGAGPDDDDARRQVDHLQHVVGRQDPDAVGRDPRQALDAAPGGEDHVGRLQDPLAARPGRAVLAVQRDAHLARPVEAPAPGNPLDLVLADQRLQAGPHPADDLVAARRDGRVVEGHVAGDQHPELAALAGDAVVEVRRFQERLRRDAAPMEARPADLVLVDQSHAQAQLGGPERGRVAAGPGTEDDEVERVGGTDGHGVWVSRGEVMRACRWALPRGATPRHGSARAPRGPRPFAREWGR